MLENGSVVLDNWIVEDKIGSGAFGTVYKIKKAENSAEHRSALKVITIPPENSEVLSLKSEGMSKEEISAYYSEIADSFMDETKLLEELKGNANIVGYEDHRIERSEDGMSFTIMIRMELLTPLKNLLAERKLTEEEVLKLGMDMCTALEVCESKKIIHRDIKPDNIFVSDTGAYKLGDFGVARTLEKTVGIMSQKGTYTYMAPEVFLGKEYNQNVDLYSLGILLYQLLNNNRTPFLPPAPQPIKFVDREEAQKKRMSGNLLPWIKGLPDSWNGLLVKMCHPDPKIRFQNAAEVKCQINKILAMGREYSLAESVKMADMPERTVAVKKQSAPVQSSVKPVVNTIHAGYANNGYRQSNQPSVVPSRVQNQYAYANNQRAYTQPAGNNIQYAHQGRIYQPNLYNQPVQQVAAVPVQPTAPKSYLEIMRGEASSARYMVISMCFTVLFTILNVMLAPDAIETDGSAILCLGAIVILGIVRFSNYLVAKRSGDGFIKPALLYIFMMINNYVVNAFFVFSVYESGETLNGTQTVECFIIGALFGVFSLVLSLKERKGVTYFLSKLFFILSSLFIMTMCIFEFM